VYNVLVYYRVGSLENPVVLFSHLIPVHCRVGSQKFIQTTIVRFFIAPNQ